MEREPLIGVDTNVLLRFILFDDPIQSVRAREFFGSLTARNGGYISLLVLSECAWTLARVYKFDRAQVAGRVEQILDTSMLEVERPAVAQRALNLYRISKADFGDCCIAALGTAAGCDYTYTFDKAAAKLPGMRLLGASQA